MKWLLIPRSACHANSSRSASSRGGRSGRSARDRRGRPRRGGTSVSRASARRRRPRSRCPRACRSAGGRRAAPWRDGAHVRLGDRVVAAEDDREHARVDDLADRALDRIVRARRVGRDDGRVAVVDDPQLAERVDLRLEVRAGRAARSADRARREAGARTVGDEVVRRRADDRDVEARQLGGSRGVRGRPEREQPRVVRLVAERLPPLERVDRAQKSFCSFIAAPMSPLILSLPLM